MVDQDISLGRRSFLAMGCAAVGAGLVRPSGVLALGSGKDWPVGVCRGVDQAETVHAGGGAYVEVSCQGWLVPQKSRGEFESRLVRIRSAPAPVWAANGFLPGSLKCVGPDADHDAIVEYAKVAFARAKEVGIRVQTFGSGSARRIPEGYPAADADLQFVSLLTKLAPLAEEQGLVLSVEPLQSSETNMINRVSEAHRLVRAVDHPSLGITPDFFHMVREDEGPESIVEAGKWVRHIHLAEKAKRTPPGTDGDDFRAYFEALETIGYEGLVSIECGWSDLGGQLPRALETIRAQVGG